MSAARGSPEPAGGRGPWPGARGLLLLGALLAAGPGVAAGAGDPRPGILLILSDDHSAPYLGAYGNPDLRTPRLDRLARDGALFTRAYTSSSQCVPSRASIVSGRSPVDIRMTRFTAPLPRDVAIFPELLRERGYFTGFVGRYHHLDGPLGKGELERRLYAEHRLATIADRVDHVSIEGKPHAELVEFLSRVPASAPFFVQVSFNDPHRPFDAAAYEPDPRTITVPHGLPDTEAIRRDLAGHYGEINRLDESVGRLLDELDSRGLRESTLVVFMGDNGAALLGGKGTLYEAGVNVPFVVRWPGRIEPGSVHDALISGEDLARTFLDVAGVPAPAEMTGVSFAPLLLGEPHASSREAVFTARGAHASNLPRDSASFDVSRSVILDRYKLIYNVTWQLPFVPVDFGWKPLWHGLVEANRRGEIDRRFAKYFAPHRSMFELFDRVRDPGETRNLAGRVEYRPVLEQLKRRLHERMLLDRDFAPLPY